MAPISIRFERFPVFKPSAMPEVMILQALRVKAPALLDRHIPESYNSHARIKNASLEKWERDQIPEKAPGRFSRRPKGERLYQSWFPTFMENSASPRCAPDIQGVSHRRKHG